MRRLLFPLGFLAPFVLFPGCTLDDDTFVCSDDDSTCKAAFLCGNNQLDPGEVCDTADEYCSEDCSESLGRCGDGIIQRDFGEACDPFNLGSLGGAGGEGSVGGASSEADWTGCEDTCHAKNGFVCDPDTNICAQTGLEPDALVSEHLEEVCTWIVGLLGGTNQGTYCREGDEVLQWVAPTVSKCVSSLVPRESCTVGELEEWARRKDRCEIYLEQSPCD